MIVLFSFVFKSVSLERVMGKRRSLQPRSSTAPPPSRAEWFCALVVVVAAIVGVELLSNFHWEIKFSVHIFHNPGHTAFP